MTIQIELIKKHFLNQEINIITMNANDLLREHSCADNYFKHPFGLLYTSGVQALCETFECYWFVDVVMSYQPELKEQEFQVWTLRRTDQSAVVSCTDGNDNILVKQRIEFTDFQPDEATIWVENAVLLLPSEH